MSFLNKAEIIGNLGKPPEIRTTQSGDKVASLSVATSVSWKDKTSGERKEKTEWHRIVIFNQGLVKIVENFLSTGSKIYIEGQMETRKWTDKEDIERYSTEIILRPYRGRLVILSKKETGQDTVDDEYQAGPDYEDYSQDEMQD